MLFYAIKCHRKTSFFQSLHKYNKTYAIISHTPRKFFKKSNFAMQMLLFIKNKLFLWWLCKNASRYIDIFIVVFAVLKLRNFEITQQNSDRMSTIVYLCYCAFGAVCVDVHLAWVACLLVWVMVAKARVRNKQQ